jgi:hypothetical protein
MSRRPEVASPVRWRRGVNLMYATDSITGVSYQRSIDMSSLFPIVYNLYRSKYRTKVALASIYTMSQKRDIYTFAHNLAKY